MDINRIKGLSAKVVAKKQKEFGFNELPNRERKNILKIVLDLVTEPMIFLLLITVIIYFFLGDKGEAFLLLFSVFGIISIDLYQERKTEKSLEALRNLSSPICDVIRDGKKKTIPGREVVVGDIILLSEGSRVPADAELVSADNLRVDESLLTGESEPVEKRTREIEDYRTNSVFSGTLVVKGHGIAEVVSIGSNTEIGKIGASLKSIGTEKTLLQKEVTRVIKVIAIAAMASSLLLTLVYWYDRGNLIQGFLAGLTLAIAIIPEEFPVVLTIFLTLGAWRLAKNNVLTRRAHTIETLGSATVLCVDKTGTLTENKMEVMSIINAKSEQYEKEFNHVSEIVKYGVLASQVKPFDPMEEAFIVLGKKVFDSLEAIYEGQDVIKEYPLEEDSLSVIHIWGGNNQNSLAALKGAPETVFDLCHLNTKEQRGLDEKAKELAKQGLRVIAIAKNDNLTNIPKNRHDIEFEFMGLVGLADPLRKEASSAIGMCKTAGIKVVMITGDYPETAMHIAQKIGLSSKGVITGAEFAELSEKKREEIIRSISVFSRVTPAHKLKIVNAFKKAGEIVAMTGDGVNDAPALKSAHIGIAMGKKGTDVAREAATIVLLDDNFASIVQGIRLGRRIYTNLQKAMSYLFSIHVPIALLSLVPVLLGWPLALIPAHIVFLEFVIDPSCTFIFENEKEEKGIMQQPPRKLSSPVFSRKMIFSSILKGLIVALVVVIAFGLLLNLGWSQDKARGMTFLILVIANIFLILGISGKQAMANILNRENKALVVIMLITIISLILSFNVPFFREIFRFGPLTIIEALAGVLIGAISILGIIPLKKLSQKYIS